MAWIDISPEEGKWMDNIHYESQWPEMQMIQLQD